MSGQQGDYPAMPNQTSQDPTTQFPIPAQGGMNYRFRPLDQARQSRRWSGNYPSYPDAPGNYPGYPNAPGNYPSYPDAPGNYPSYPDVPGNYPSYPDGPGNYLAPQRPPTSTRENDAFWANSMPER